MGRHKDLEALEYRARLWAQGLDEKQIAERCGLKVKTIRNYINSNRDMFPRRDFGKHKSTIDKMWRLYGDGLSDYEIAKSLGVTVATIHEWMEDS